MNTYIAVPVIYERRSTHWVETKFAYICDSITVQFHLYPMLDVSHYPKIVYYAPLLINAHYPYALTQCGCATCT